MDLTKDHLIAAFERSMKIWEERLAKDDKMEVYGYVDVEGIDLPQYSRGGVIERL